MHVSAVLVKVVIRDNDAQRKVCCPGQAIAFAKPSAKATGQADGTIRVMHTKGQTLDTPVFGVTCHSRCTHGAIAKVDVMVLTSTILVICIDLLRIPFALIVQFSFPANLCLFRNGTAKPCTSASCSRYKGCRHCKNLIAMPCQPVRMLNFVHSHASIDACAHAFPIVTCSTAITSQGPLKGLRYCL